MADKRLIDANALMVKVAHRNVLDVLPNVDFERSFVYSTVQNDMFKLVEKAPTIDAVEVVRCRKCIHRGYAYCPMCHEEYHFDEDDGTDYVTRDYTEDDGFCHCGEKLDAKDMDVPTKDGGASDGSD